MIVVMKPHADEIDIQSVIEFLNRYGFDVHRSSGLERTVLGAIGVKPAFDHRGVALLAGVDVVHRVTRSTGRTGRPSVTLGRTRIGGGTTGVFCVSGVRATANALVAGMDRWSRFAGLVIRGGSLDADVIGESRDMLHAGGRCLVLDLEGMDFTGPVGSLPTLVDAVVLPENVAGDHDVLRRYADPGCPVFLRRPPGDLSVWFEAASVVESAGGVPALLLGTTGTGNTVDLGVLGTIQKLASVPVVVDASHADEDTLWSTCALAGIAAGADGVFSPGSDAGVEGARRLAELTSVASAVGRPVAFPEGLA